MSKSQQVLDFLNRAISLRSEDITESFYIDTVQDKAFSIHVLDYFLFKENGERNESIESNDSKEEEKLIIDWIHRIENEDRNLIKVPQLGIKDSTLGSKKIDEFLEENNLSKLTLEVWIPSTNHVNMKNQSNHSK